MENDLKYNYFLGAKSSRIAAFFLDHFIASFCIAMVFLFFIEIEKGGELDESDFNLFIGIIFTMIICYFGKDFYKGISLGKWMFGLMVRDERNPAKVPSFLRLFLRNLLIVIWPIELILLFTNDGKRLGDKVAKTIVIENSNGARRGARLLTIGLIFLLLLTGLFFSMKNSEAYETAIREIEKNEEVLLESGRINGYGYFPIGGINVSNGIGNADFEIKVYGDKKNLGVSVRLKKERGGEWELVELKY
ncbi:MAG: RDD family protein [Saprospiraceae bacterium]